MRIPLQFAQVGASENFILVQRTRFRVVVRLPLVAFALFAFVRVIRVYARLSLTRTKNAMGSTYKRDNRVFVKKL